MEKRRRLEPIDGEIELPQPVIQHVQSFLNGKQAAQTTVLSKSWYNAWLTRPNLDFDDQDFVEFGGPDPSVGFLNFVKKTIRRYEELNLKISSLKLSVKRPCSLESLSFVNKLVMKAIRMGVEDIHLFAPKDFLLPFEVLETETLARLSLVRTRIKLPCSVKMSCSRIKSLRLEHILGGDDLLFRVLPCFENLENLTLGSITGFKWPLNCPTVKSLCMRGTSLCRDFVSCAFPCVKDLTLQSCYDLAGIRDELFSLSFPCLENLTIETCYDTKALQISSRSLKFISLSLLRNSGFKFDVPNIRKFKFLGYYYPSSFPVLSFATVSGQWESDVSLHIQGLCTTDLWCHRLRRFIRKLSMSKVSLGVQFDVKVSYKNGGELKGKPGPVVENLRLLNPLPYSAISDLLNGLLWSCPPKFITQYRFPSSCINASYDESTSNECIKFLYKGLIEVRKSCSAQDQILFGNLDLGEVNVECFDATLGVWQPMPWKTLLSDSESPRREQEIRFRLEWHRKL